MDLAVRRAVVPAELRRLAAKPRGAQEKARPLTYDGNRVNDAGHRCVAGQMLRRFQ
jgi:hypothetical protein